MTHEQVALRVRTVVAGCLCVALDQVRPDATFDSLGGDSLDRVELVLMLEEEFEIEVPDEDGEKLTTVQAAIDYVVNRVKP